MSYRDTDVKHSDTPSWNSGGTANALPEERAKTTFEIETMTNFLDGGKKETMRRRWIQSSTEDLEDVGGTSARYDLERTGVKGGIATNFKHFMDIHKKHLDRFMIPQGNDMLYMTCGQTMGGYPGFGLFLTTLQGQCSAEQLGWWLPKAFTMQITGAYAQTELGHGSNVRGLETTAEYDPKTQEFVLNTPTLSSMKWWPSSMASATHAVVYAQLLINGKEHGLHVFFVQLRDENFEPLQGVEVGDLGAKAGENEVDIGYLRMKDVRIPRRHMMEKRQHVEPDGTYIKHDMGEGENNEKAAYTTMMTARGMLVAGSSVFLAKGATIAIRYNAVRKQGFKDTAQGQSYLADENKIIDYKSNLYVLLKYLSLAYAIRFTSNWLSDRIADLMQDSDSVADLPELHASSAGLKGYCCNEVAIGLEELRKSCGGASYLLASGIAALVADYKWRATAEGETNVMLLQTARYLMKACDDAKNGRPLSGLTECLSVLKDPNYDPLKNPPKLATTAREFLSPEYLLEWFKYRTIVQVLISRRILDDHMKRGESFDQAWGALTLRMVATGQTHILYFLLSKFISVMQTCEDPACRAVLEQLCAMFALSDFVDGKQWNGLIPASQVELIEEAINIVCKDLRPNAVGLAESWDFTDKALGSTIGGSKGDIYEQQYLAAARSPTNKDRVPDFFKAIEPYVDKEFLALRNKPCEDCDPNDIDCYPPPLKTAKL